MKLRRLIALLITSFLAISCPALQAEEPAKPAADNLLTNGDFEKGVANWRGDRKVIAEEGNPDNHVAEVTSTKRQPRIFSQEISTRGMKDIILKFRYKPSADYDGRGLQIRFVRHNSGFTFNDKPLKGGADWNDFTWKFGQIEGENKITLEVEVKDGEKGTVWFDDFSILEVK